MDRIAISIVRDDKGLERPMDERFGRAEAFLVVDRETGEPVETIDNAVGRRLARSGYCGGQHAASPQGSAVVSGRFGPKASDALRALGIEAWIAPPGINAGRGIAHARKGSPGADGAVIPPMRFAPPDLRPSPI